MTSVIRLKAISLPVIIVRQILSTAMNRGYGLYKPELFRDKDNKTQETKDDDGTMHIVEHRTIGPPKLEAYKSIPEIPSKWEKYKGEYLIQQGDNAYLLSLSTQRIAASHPYDNDIFLYFVAMACVAPLGPSFGEEQEYDWLQSARNRIPKPSYERFNLAHIENDNEGILIEIHDDWCAYVTINTDDQLIIDLFDNLKQALGLVEEKTLEEA